MSVPLTAAVKVWVPGEALLELADEFSSEVLLAEVTPNDRSELIRVTTSAAGARDGLLAGETHMQACVVLVAF